MTNKTETELLQDAIRANGGTCDDLPDTLPSTLYKKLIETCGSGGGGGGGLPTGGTPHQQLVTDGEGNAKWEDRILYRERVQAEVIPETQITLQSGTFSYTGQLTNPPVVGVNHAVSINGNVYNCVAIALQGAIALGNPAIMGMGDDTGEPFCIGFVPEYGVQGAVSFSAPSFTLSVAIDGEVANKLPAEFLPEQDKPTFIIDVVAGETYAQQSVTDAMTAFYAGKNVMCRLTLGSYQYLLPITGVGSAMVFSCVCATHQETANTQEITIIETTAIKVIIRPNGKAYYGTKKLATG